MRARIASVTLATMSPPFHSASRPYGLGRAPPSAQELARLPRVLAQRPGQGAAVAPEPFAEGPLKLRQ